MPHDGNGFGGPFSWKMRRWIARQVRILGSGNFCYSSRVSDNSEPGNTNAGSPNQDFVRLEVSQANGGGRPPTR